jgi:hypothetical protein
MGAERVDLDAMQAYFEQWQNLSLDGSVIGEIAVKALAVVAELRAEREKLAAIGRLLEASPIGPTRAQAVAMLFEIRLVATNQFDQPGKAAL